MTTSHRIRGCRLCESTDLHLILDLGSTALANRFLRADQVREPEPRYPLRLCMCPECGLVQIDETVPPEVLFADYIYVSGTSDLIHRHAAYLAQSAVDRYALSAGDTVLEIASNDGTVLNAFRKHGARVVGVEPAANIAQRANDAGIHTINAFFHEQTAEEIRGTLGRVRMILARHVLAHVADLHSFVAGIRTLLTDDGVALIEVPHLLPFFEKVEYDTVYHEHLCYFSVDALRKLGRRHGLELIDVEETAIHGGSIIAAFQPRESVTVVKSSVDKLLAREERVGLTLPGPWFDFAARVEESRATLRRELARQRSRGKTVMGYGAAAKAMTLLAYCDLGPSDIPSIADRSPFKQNLFTPGHHIPVVSPERIAIEEPDVLVLLAWNFAGEIMAQQSAHSERGGEFLLPLPEATLISPRSRRLVVPVGDAA